MGLVVKVSGFSSPVEAAGGGAMIERVAKSDADLIADALRAVLASEGTSGKALAAKAQAARQLGLLTGLIKSADEAAAAAAEDGLAPDPMADLQEDELARQRRLRTRRRSA